MGRLTPTVSNGSDFETRRSDGEVRRADWKGRALHLVGVGGAGMSGLARIAVELGATVSGSDKASGGVVEQLKGIGVTVFASHQASNVPEGSEIVYSSAVAADNPERARGRELGLKELHRSELLGEMTRLRRTIAVTGTHGKTTTTAMIVSALRGAGMQPGWAVGADLAGGEANAGWGDPDCEWFIVEADESDRSLLALTPEVAVLTNCELDHHATYDSLDDLRRTLAKFLDAAPIAVVWDQPELLELVGAGTKGESYDAKGASSGPTGASFQWRGHSVQLAVPGVHNAVNAAGALTAAACAQPDETGLIEGIKAFAGTGRRFQRVGASSAGATLIDDYAHHPTEVAATIAAARSLAPRRVVAVFQPHLFSRTEAFFDEFGIALAAADCGLVLDIYPARELAADFPGVTSALIVDAANAASGSQRFSAAGGIESASAMLRDMLADGDVCLLMGAGDVGSIAKLVAA